MRPIPTLVFPAAMMLAAALTVSGCGKSSKQQPGSANPTQPAAQSASQPAQPGQSPTQAAQPAPPPAPIVVPVGTHLRVRLDEPLGSKISVPGQKFRATVADDVMVNGLDVIPRGGHAEGTVIAAKSLGHIKGGALLELRLERIRTDSGTFPVATSTMERAEKGKGGRTARFAGGGGAFGAILGGLAGGGKGALIGAAAGAGAGTAGSAMTGNKEIYLPAETLVTFRLEKPVQMTQ